ncbi:MAG: hypothetical protein ACXAEU_25910 [Candidatus Hodarchaeales archaeon]
MKARNRLLTSDGLKGFNQVTIASLIASSKGSYLTNRINLSNTVIIKAVSIR